MKKENATLEVKHSMIQLADHLSELLEMRELKELSINDVMNDIKKINDEIKELKKQIK